MAKCVRFNGGLWYWGNFHAFYYYWAEEYRSGFHCIHVYNEPPSKRTQKIFQLKRERVEVYLS